MGRWARHLRRLADHVEAFGPLDGPRLAARVSVAQRSRAAEVALRVPGVPWPVRLRPRTSDVNTFEQVFVHREHAIGLARPPRTIVDAGANVGYASMFFAATWPGARIIAIEPDAANHELLARNVAPIPGVTTI